jgi:hypothetical protein
MALEQAFVYALQGDDAVGPPANLLPQYPMGWGCGWFGTPCTP